MASQRSHVVLARGEGEVSAVAIERSSSPGRVAWVRPYQGIEVWDLERRERLLTAWDDAALQVTAVHLLPDGKRAVSNGFFTSAWLWDLATGALIHDLVWDDVASSTHSALSPDGRTLLLTDEQGGACVLDVESAKILRKLPGLLPGMGAPVFFADGRRVAFGIDAGPALARVQDLETGLALHDVTFPDPAYSTLAAPTPNGRALVIAVLRRESRCELIVRDLVTGHIFRLGTTREAVTHLVVAPDGRSALTVTRVAVELWDLVAGGLLDQIAGDDLFFRSADLHPDGRHVVTGGHDGTVRLWELSAGA